MNKKYKNWTIALEKIGNELSNCKSFENAADIACIGVIREFGIKQAFITKSEINDSISFVAFHVNYEKKIWNKIIKHENVCLKKVSQTCQSILISDICKNPAKTPYCDEIGQYCDFNSCGVFPMLAEKKCVGIFAIRAKNTNEDLNIIEFSPIMEILVQQLVHIWEKNILKDELKNLKKSIDTNFSSINMKENNYKDKTQINGSIHKSENFLNPISKTFTQKEKISSDNNIKKTSKILLVDDNIDSINLMQIRLTRANHQVSAVRNGLEAVELYQKEKFDLILMDINMPKMDGVEATKRIRKIETDKSQTQPSKKYYTPIFALTASILDDEKKKYFESKMDEVVAKPVNFKILFDKINDYLKKDNSSSEKEFNKKTITNQRELPIIDGVNVEKGLLIWKEMDAYIWSLTHFANKYEKSTELILELLEQGAIDQARAIVHSMKGVAGNLCITEVCSVAKKIDSMLKMNRIERAKKQLDLLEYVVKIAIQSINKIDYQVSKVMHLKKEFNLNDVENIFNKIMKSFDSFNPKVIKPFVDDLSQYLSDNQIKPINNYLDQFEMDNAKKEIVLLAKRLSINIEGVNG